MGYSRSHTVPQDVGGIYHCYSRCVRRERLLEPSDRMTLLERRLAFLSTRVFAIDLIEFKPMGNHIHGIVRVHPELAWCWTDEEIARRWLLLSLAGRRPDLADGEAPSECAIAALVEKKPRIEELRRRLSDLGTYHSAWKEWSAKRFNREDRISGHFWQGRYGVTTALDDGAVLMQSVYVLLNGVHAGLESELGTRTRGSLKTRIEQLLRKAAEDASRTAKAEVFDREFVHASWTPVYPCDPGSAAQLGDAEFAKRVAAGRHRASFRSSLREEALALAYFASRGEGEEVERAARELREPHGEASPNAIEPSETASESDPQHRPRPANGPRHRHRSWPHRATAPRTVLKPDARCWLSPLSNPFHRTRLVNGAMPVLADVTLGMLVNLADEEGRHPRPDKRGAIASNAERAILRLRRVFLGEGDREDERDDERVTRLDRGLDRNLDGYIAAPSVSTPLPAIAAARELAASFRAGIDTLVSRVVQSGANRSDGSGADKVEQATTCSSNQPMTMTLRGTAFGAKESLDTEAIRRGGTIVHAVRLQVQLRE